MNEKSVRRRLLSLGIRPILSNKFPPTKHYVIAVESGTSARIVENIFQAAGAVFEAQGLNVRFGDSPARQDIRFATIPDAIIENL